MVSSGNLWLVVGISQQVNRMDWWIMGIYPPVNYQFAKVSMAADV